MPIATGILNPGTPFNYIFPEGKVPLVSSFPGRHGEGLPISFVLDGELLSDTQVELLCHEWLRHHPEQSYAEAYTIVRLHYPIQEKFIRARF